MRQSGLAKVIAALGIALLMAGTDVCLLVTCASAQADGLAPCLARDDCPDAQGVAGASRGHHHDEDAAGSCARPCCLQLTIAPSPQVPPPIATSPVVPSVAITPVVVQLPVPEQPEQRGHATVVAGPSPPAPSFLAATGVRAPPTA